MNIHPPSAGVTPEEQAESLVALRELAKWSRLLNALHPNSEPRSIRRVSQTNLESRACPCACRICGQGSPTIDAAMLHQRHMRHYQLHYETCAFILQRLPTTTTTNANDHHSGTQKKESDLTQLEQENISSPWYAANAHEPPWEEVLFSHGSPKSPTSMPLNQFKYTDDYVIPMFHYRLGLVYVIFEIHVGLHSPLCCCSGISLDP